jgi:acetyltransferase EpsM
MKIIIYGTGQIGSVVNNILKDAGHEIVGYVDDNISLHSKKINGVQVFGGGKWLLKKKGYDRVCLGVGTINSRKKILNWLSKYKIPLISAIHPSVIISSDVKIGKSVTIGANSLVYGNTKIGLGTFIGPSVTVSHDTDIGKFCLISVGSIIGARVCIQEEVFIGSGSILTPKRLRIDSKLLVQKNAIIGAGSLVIDDVLKRDKVVGVPAKSINLYKN